MIKEINDFYMIDLQKNLNEKETELENDDE